jgi:rhodanese-related sulfurtransferase
MNLNRRRRTFAAVTLAALITAGCSNSGTISLPDSFSGVSVDQATEIIETYGGNDFVLLDVRTPEEFASGHLDGAVNVDFYSADFATSLAALDRDDRFLVYCRTGNRSGSTLELMEQLGFQDVHHLDGGIVSWSTAGGVVVP